MKTSNKNTMEIKTPLRYPGGKSRAAEMLSKHIPSFSEYREPFLGGGSVFIKMKQLYPNKSFWINDLYYDLYCFWNEIKSNYNDVIKIILDWKQTYIDGQTLHEYLKNNIQNFSNLQKAAAFFILNRITFSGTILSGGYSKQAFEKRFTQSSIDRLQKIVPLLKDTKITNLDYSDVISCNGNNVLIFMDPPYYTTEKSALYGKNGELHKGFDHEKLSETIKSCKHNFMLTYDDCDYIRELYKDYNITPFSIMYGMKNVTHNAKMKGNEILITNF